MIILVRLEDGFPLSEEGIYMNVQMENDRGR